MFFVSNFEHDRQTVVFMIIHNRLTRVYKPECFKNFSPLEKFALDDPRFYDNRVFIIINTGLASFG